MARSDIGGIRRRSGADGLQQLTVLRGRRFRLCGIVAGERRATDHLFREQSLQLGLALADHVRQERLRVGALIALALALAPREQDPDPRPARGLLQDERHPLYLFALAGAALGISALHLAAALRESSRDREPTPTDGWVDVGEAAAIAEGRATTGLVAGERVAVFRHLDHLSCVSNVCKHQNGPLGEGRIIDGCITCPWHGYQYRPDSGTSPPPFTDTIPTFNLAVVKGRVLIDPVPNPAGTRVEPVPVKPTTVQDPSDFYVGYQPEAPTGLARFVRATVAVVFVSGLGLVVAFAVAQQTYQSASFEFGRTRVIEGVVRAHPYPMLEVSRPGTETVSRYILAATGKWGAQATGDRLDGQRARISGTLAYRDNLTVLEIASADGLGAASAPAKSGQPQGRYRLVGEIVDSKCYVGVMNPGRGATHRGCAVRCLNGGLTPMMVVRGPGESSLHLVVTGADGRPLPHIDRWAGRTVVLEGQVETVDDLWFIRVGPEGIGSAR